jgi:hypothetical protein
MIPLAYEDFVSNVRKPVLYRYAGKQIPRWKKNGEGKMDFQELLVSMS